MQGRILGQIFKAASQNLCPNFQQVLYPNDFLITYVQMGP